VVDAGGNGFRQAFAINSLFSVVSKSFTAPSAGTLIVTGTVNFGNTSSSAGQFAATIQQTAGGSTEHLVSIGAGNVTAQYESGVPMLSITVTQGQVVTMNFQISSTIGTATPAPTYKWDWSMIFYASS
jgi:hypothetical protein